MGIMVRTRIMARARVRARVASSEQHSTVHGADQRPPHRCEQGAAVVNSSVPEPRRQLLQDRRSVAAALPCVLASDTGT